MAFANKSDTVRAQRLYNMGHRCFYVEVSDQFGRMPRVQYCETCRAAFPISEPGADRDAQDAAVAAFFERRSATDQSEKGSI